MEPISASPALITANSSCSEFMVNLFSLLKLKIILLGWSLSKSINFVSFSKTLCVARLKLAKAHEYWGLGALLELL
jgi:hypothetical protein